MKRFTETKKWDDPWYMGLSPITKLLYQYLLDHCDNSGVVEPNTKLASFQIGETIEEHHFRELGDRIKTLPNGKIMIPKFIGFQFGTLKKESPVHRSIFKLLSIHGIAYPIDTLSEPFVKGVRTPKDKDKDKDPDKDKDKDKDKDTALPECEIPTWDEFWVYAQVVGLTAEWYAKDRFDAARQENWRRQANWRAYVDRCRTWWESDGRPMNRPSRNSHVFPETALKQLDEQILRHPCNPASLVYGTVPPTTELKAELANLKQQRKQLQTRIGNSGT